MLELKMIGQYLVIFVVLTWVGILLSHWKIRRMERELREAPFVPAYNYSPPRRRRGDRKKSNVILSIVNVPTPKWANKKLGE